ncbi:hypothetical protein DL96DRAFT_1712089 [Flagelloscypha sp. PMI_526]|nr:hypothetical protein DL96DRAFT_1712089 [Flagelloscypha sp. PMI_526]
MPNASSSSSWVSQWLSSQRTDGPKFGDAAASYHPSVAAPSPRKPFITFNVEQYDDDELDEEEDYLAYSAASATIEISLDEAFETSSASSLSSSPASTPSPKPPQQSTNQHLVVPFEDASTVP